MKKTGRAGKELRREIYQSASNVKTVSITLDIMWTYYVKKS